MSKQLALPGPDDGLEGLNRLIEQVGAANFQRFVRWCRDGGDTVITDVIAREAGAEIAQVLADNPAMKYQAARLHVANRWGYAGNTLPNFYRFANRGYTEVTGNDPR